MSIVSGYTWATNVRGKLLPYIACIRSMLMLADEVWVAYDPRFDVAETFTSIDPERVHVVAFPYHIEKITGNADQLNAARERCAGDWLIWLDLDEVIHEKDVEAIQNLICYADSHDFDSVELSMYNYVMREYSFRHSEQWGIRPKILKNIKARTHGILNESIRERPDGSQYLSVGDGLDFVTNGVGCQNRTLVYRDYPFLATLDNDRVTCEDVLRTTYRFPHIYHYARYSMQRKRKMEGYGAFAYFVGDSDHYEPEIWLRQLSSSVRLVPEREIPDGSFWEPALGPVQPSHPAVVHEWVAMIDDMIGVTDG